MSSKKLLFLKRGWRPTSTNERSNFDSSSDSSDGGLPCMHSYLSAHTKSDTLSSIEELQYGALGAPPRATCSLAHDPFLPPMQPIDSTLVNRPVTSGGDHLLHHDYAERMTEQLIQDTFNSEVGDLHNYGPDGVCHIGHVVPRHVEMPAPLDLCKCPLKKRPLFARTDNYGGLAQNDGMINFEGPFPGTSVTVESTSHCSPQLSSGRSCIDPPSVHKVIWDATASGSSYAPSCVMPSSSGRRNKLKLRPKKINLGGASSSAYTAPTCTLSRPSQSEVGNTLGPVARDTSIFSFVPSTIVQHRSSLRADPIVDDSSQDIQFISMERQPSACFALSHASERSERRRRKRRRMRRRMLLGMLGKTYVSDEVIVVDDGQDGRQSQVQYSVPVPGPSSHRRRSFVSITDPTSEGSLHPAVPRATLEVTGHCGPVDNVDMENGDAVLNDRPEVTVERDLSDDSVTRGERSATPDSVVAITPTEEPDISSSEVPPRITLAPFAEVTQDGDEQMLAESTEPRQRVVVPIYPQALSPDFDLNDSTGSEPVQLYPEQVDMQALTRQGLDIESDATTCFSPCMPSFRSMCTQQAVQDAMRAAVTEEHTGCVEVEGQPPQDDEVEDVPATGTKTTEEGESTRAEKERKERMELVSILECPVCLELMGPPISQCVRGHIVCSSCKPMLRYCPTCRSPFGEHRNLIAEMFTERLYYPCKNSITGCNETFKLNVRKNHEDNCKFRLYECVLCPWKGLREQLLPHLTKDHPDKVGHGPQQDILLEFDYTVASTDQTWIVSAMNEIFCVNFNLVRQHRNMEMRASVQFVGPRRNCGDFVYSFEVNNKKNCERVYSSNRTHSDLDECHSYFNREATFLVGNCLSFCSGDGNKKRVLVKLCLEKFVPV